MLVADFLCIKTGLDVLFMLTGQIVRVDLFADHSSGMLSINGGTVRFAQPGENVDLAVPAHQNGDRGWQFENKDLLFTTNLEQYLKNTFDGTLNGAAIDGSMTVQQAMMLA